jgi:hypothetical protein
MNKQLPLQSTQLDSILMIHRPSRNRSHNLLFDTSLYEKNIYDLKNRIVEEPALESTALTQEWLTTHGFKKINHVDSCSFYHHKAYKLSVYLDPYCKIEWLGYKTNCLLDVKSLKEFVFTLYRKDI